MRNRVLKRILNQYIHREISSMKEDLKKADAFTMECFYEYIDRLEAQNKPDIFAQMKDSTSFSSDAIEKMWTQFRFLHIKYLQSAYHEIWCSRHQELVSALEEYLVQYPRILKSMEPNWENMAFNHAKDYRELEKYIQHLHSTTTASELNTLLAPFIAKQHLYSPCDELLPEFWKRVSQHLNHQWVSKYNEKKSKKARRHQSELQKLKRESARNLQYQTQISTVSSQNMLYHRTWYINDWRNELFDLCATGDSCFNNEISHEFQKHENQSYLMLTACHTCVLNTELSLQAAHKIQNIPIRSDIFEIGSTNPVAVSQQNRVLDEDLRSRLQHLSQHCKYRILTAYWSRCENHLTIYGMMPIYLLFKTDPELSNDQFYEMGRILKERFAQRCIFFHSSETPNICSGFMKFNESDYLPLEGKNIHDVADMFARLIFSENQDNHLECIRYLNAETEDEYDHTRRCIKGEDFWPRHAHTAQEVSETARLKA